MTEMNQLKIALSLAIIILILTACRKKTDIIIIQTEDCPGVCQNGGTCNEATGYCECPQGYEGALCQFEVDSCFMVICLNGGTCSSGLCNCPIGWTGADCSIPTVEDITYSPAAILDICPNHIGGSNENFSGDGPLVTITTTATILESKKVNVNLVFHLIQTAGNSPTEGLKEIDVIIYEAPVGQKIIELLSSDVSNTNYTDDDHDVDIVYPLEGALVKRFESIGDTPYKDLDDCSDGSSLDVYFNDLNIKLIIDP